MKYTSLTDIPYYYPIILADPPWLYYGSATKDQAAGKHYSCMSLEELQALPVQKLAGPKTVLLLWSTSAKMEDAIKLMRAWGFFYRGVFQVWVKTNQAGKIINGQGVRPSYIKPTAEYLLIGATDAKGRTLPLTTEAMPNVVLAGRPGNKHSAKPAIFQENIEALFGNVARIELFAREERPGWDCWGNEV